MVHMLVTHIWICVLDLWLEHIRVEADVEFGLTQRPNSLGRLSHNLT